MGWWLGWAWGAAAIRASGSGGMQVDGRIGNRQINLSGSGGVRADSVNGPLSFEATGSGGLKLGTINADQVKIRTSGDGGVTIRDGRTVGLQVSATGSADADLNIAADRADLSTCGSGDIRVRQVTGPVSQRRTGSGTIRIGG